MSALADTSVLRQFLDFMSRSANSIVSATGADLPAGDELRHELDSFVALALAAYEELADLTREMTSPAIPAEPTQQAEIIRRVREAHARYFAASQPVLRLIQASGRRGIEPKRLDRFMLSVAEADLIANRYDRIMESELQAGTGRTRSLEELRDELRDRIHSKGG